MSVRSRAKPPRITRKNGGTSKFPRFFSKGEHSHMATGITNLALILALLFLRAAFSSAGEYHYGQSLLCYDCHTMHFSMSHTWDGTGTISTTPGTGGNWLGTNGPNNYLLKGSTTNTLCLSCHDGRTFAPDVLGPNTNSYVRQAGALSSGSAPYEDWKGHTLDGLVTPPGGAMNIRLECVNCHSPHGNASYRNLDGIISPVTYAKGTNDLTKDVFLRSWTLGDLATNYSVGNVDFNEPAVTPQNQGSAMSKLCKGCHTDFHGRAGDSNMGGTGGTGWLRHPTADANIGAVGGGHSNLSVFASKAFRVKVMSPSGDWGTQGSTWPAALANLTPNCLTCHKAHGNQNPFGLIFLAGTGPITEEGDSDGNSNPNPGVRLRALCGQCHVQAN